MIDHKRAQDLIEPFEGRIPHMYLDSEGYVTTGVGNLLATAQAAIALVWNWRDQEGEPGEVEISDEWQRVHRAVAGMDAHVYRRLTTMDLVDSEITRLFNRRVDEFETSLQHAFPAFAAWPEPAQLAVLDMAFNLGAAALANRWPKLKACLLRQDWINAAANCHRPQSREARNLVVRNLFFEAAGAPPASNPAA